MALFHGEEPREAVPSHPPLVVVEIVSPSDTYTDLVQKLEQFHKWGVPNVWLADPGVRRFYIYGDAGLHEVSELSLPALGLVIRPADAF